MAARFLIPIPPVSIDFELLEQEIHALDENAIIHVLGTHKKIRIIHNDDHSCESYEAIINAHDGAASLLQKAIEQASDDIDQFAEDKTHERIDWDGSNFAACLESQFRIKSKLQDAVYYNDHKSAEDPPFEIIWIARPVPRPMNQQDFSNLAYVIEARISHMVFNANYHKYMIKTTCSTPQEVADYDYSGGWEWL